MVLVYLSVGGLLLLTMVIFGLMMRSVKKAVVSALRYLSTKICRLLWIFTRQIGHCQQGLPLGNRGRSLYPVGKLSQNIHLIPTTYLSGVACIILSLESIALNLLAHLSFCWRSII